ncbi:MAG TPA: L-aspartate oxidase [Actinobacteria bacterium]|nr:L-aspartate oxidase [Actinomycetota bacterium]
MAFEKIPRYLVSFDTKNLKRSESDVLIIGSGIAGLTAALKCCQNHSITLLTKGELKETATWYAQGGVATAMSEEDSPELHYQDTMRAGVGLCEPEAVRVLVNEARGAIEDLIELGVDFDRALNGEIKLAREGGHSLSRILHSGDTTGSEILSTLVERIRTCPGIKIQENVFVLDLLTFKNRCVGALVFEPKNKELIIYFAKAIILAAGGCGQIYEVTTSPSIATGDGIAMAYRAGAEVCDLEFIQFHPTALDDKKSPRFLITEALRGEGAYLRDCAGKRFMVGIHPLAELAPRDIVAREMVKVIQKCKACGKKKGDYVYLDATHIPEEILEKRFPAICERCKESGYNLSKDLIPVSPAAHYVMGGIKIDTFGRASLPGLYVSGEVACTGIHGANRLASNSLLEGLVFSRRICAFLKDHINAVAEKDVFEGSLTYDLSRKKKSIAVPDLSADRHGGRQDLDKYKDTLRKIISSYVGVVRDKEGLKKALAEISKLSEEVFEIQFDEVEGFELQNMLIVAELIIQSALAREESRGAHFRGDFPETDDLNWKKHIILRRDLRVPKYMKVKDA